MAKQPYKITVLKDIRIYIGMSVTNVYNYKHSVYTPYGII